MLKKEDFVKRYAKNKYSKKRGIENSSFKTERNLHIVKICDSGVYTLAEIGRQFSISRERVRQIYKVVTGLPYTQRIKQRQLAKKLLTNLHNKTEKFTCQNCGKSVTYGESMYRRDPKKGKIRRWAIKYCLDCFNIYRKEFRDLTATWTCTYCGKKYHPFRSSVYGRYNKNRVENGGATFCSHDHYVAWRFDKKRQPEQNVV